MTMRQVAFLHHARVGACALRNNSVGDITITPTLRGATGIRPTPGREWRSKSGLAVPWQHLGAPQMPCSVDRAVSGGVLTNRTCPVASVVTFSRSLQRPQQEFIFSVAAMKMVPRKSILKRGRIW